MLVNSSLTIYHKYLDPKEKLEKWIRFNYGTNEIPKVWWYGGKNVYLNKGLENANDIKIRIPYDINPELDFNNFSVGDILVQGKLDFDITSIKDLSKYENYSIKSLSNNTFGINKHIHIEGK